MQKRGLTVHTIEYEWGTKIRPDDVARALAEHPVKAVLLTHSETSTGVIQPVEQLAKVANDAGALVIVDVVSSLGAVPFAFAKIPDERYIVHRVTQATTCSRAN